MYVLYEVTLAEGADPDKAAAELRQVMNGERLGTRLVRSVDRWEIVA